VSERAIDLRFELEREEEAVPGGPVTRVASRASARTGGDIDRLDPAGPACCLTWVPGLAPVVLDAFACQGPRWRGLVRVVPSDWGGEAALLPWLIDDLAAVLAAIRRALLIELDDTSPPWQGIYRLASTFTTLPLVLGAGAGTHLEIARALCRACPNVLFESSTLQSDPVQAVVGSLGASRVVYGSGWPRRDAEEALATVAAAGLAEDERELVLWGNAEALLGGSWSG
jgi:hypothetical protein